MINIRWYLPMELLGLVKDVSGEYNDGTTYTVSAKCDDVLLWMVVGFMAFCLVFGVLMALMKGQRGMKAVKVFSAVLIVYAVLLAVGIGPYVELYPQGAGFIDLSTIEHIVDGIYMALCAGLMFFGGKTALWIKNKNVNKDKTDERHV